MNVGELTASFSLDEKSVSAAINSLQGQFAGLGTGVAGLGLTKTVTKPIFNFAKEMFSAGTQFEATMSRVGALSGTTGEAFDGLRQKALEVGAATSKSAQQAAEGMTVLAMAGFDASQIDQLISPVVQLSEIAGSDDMARLAGYVSDISMAFSSGNADDAALVSQNVVDMFAKTITSANLDIDDLGAGPA